MSRNSTRAANSGSTHVALGFLTGFVSLDFRLMTVLSCLRIWLETVRDQALRLVGAHIDVTDRMVAQETLRESLPPLPKR
jgi:hypothetical protein